MYPNTNNKMSKSSRNTILLLSMIHGALKLLIQDGLTEREDIGSLLLYANDYSEEVIQKYPSTGDEKKNLKQMIYYLNIWKKMIDEPTINWPNVVLVTMSQNIIEDLLSIVQNTEKRTLLEPLAECVRALAKKIEAESITEEYKYLEQSNEVLYKMYDLIEFPYRS